jgi:glycosidase
MGSLGHCEDSNPANQQWWKNASVYQIYPASFKDSNGDGIGDIPGIISKLDYIASLGVDVVWVSPMYDSPQVDMGYDVSDYENVYPPYGTVQDMDRLIDETHKRGMRIILDLVVNHSSDEHAWFQESRSSKTNPKRDWYIWRPAKYDEQGNRKPPNNWRSMFCGSSWEWDELTQEYYLHLFAAKQPDLNWENEDARKAIYRSAMEFWLNKGIDGFRIDCVNMYSKGDLRDAPVTEPSRDTQDAGLTFCNGPRMGEFLDEMSTVLAKYDTMTVGECPFTPDRNQVLSYVSAAAKRLSMVFQFDVVESGSSHARKFDVTPGKDWLVEFKDAVNRTQSLINDTDAWTTAFIENHDWSRSISRFGSDKQEHRVMSGKMLALMLSALSGTLYIYQGQEIGMINVPSSWNINQFKDLDAQNYYNELCERSNGDATTLKDAWERIRFIARDNARTPMPWTSEGNAGFSTAKPWMDVNEDYVNCNVEDEQKEPDSVLAFWKRMIALRRQYTELFIHGHFTMQDPEDASFFTFTKENDEKKAAVLLNFSDTQQTRPLPKGFDAAELLVSTADKIADALQPWEGRIYVV